jgi:chromosome partitioning protein
MAGKVLTIAQQKGGAGKTTLVAQLAVAFAAAGRHVALVDIDPQASLATWHQTRVKAHGDGRHPLTLSAVAGWKAATEVSRLSRNHDLVIIDSPPHAETEAKTAVRLANLVLIPIQPSPMDVWATRPTIDLARGAGVPVLLVLNRVPPRGKLVGVMRKRLEEGELPVAASTIGNRLAFAASMLDGLSVIETAHASPAARETRALAEEIGRRFWA